MTQEPNKCAVTKRFCKLRTADSVLMAMWDRLSACVCLNRISLMFWFVDWFSACLQASSSNMKKWRMIGALLLWPALCLYVILRLGSRTCIHGMQWRQWIWTYLWSDIYDAILCVWQIAGTNKNGGF